MVRRRPELSCDWPSGIRFNVINPVVNGVSIQRTSGFFVSYLTASRPFPLSVESHTALKLYIWWYVNLLDDLYDSDGCSRVKFELHIPARHPTFI